MVRKCEQQHNTTSEASELSDLRMNKKKHQCIKHVILPNNFTGQSVFSCASLCGDGISLRFRGIFNSLSKRAHDGTNTSVALHLTELHMRLTPSIGQAHWSTPHSQSSLAGLEDAIFGVSCAVAELQCHRQVS